MLSREHEVTICHALISKVFVLWEQSLNEVKQVSTKKRKTETLRLEKDAEWAPVLLPKEGVQQQAQGSRGNFKRVDDDDDDDDDDEEEDDYDDEDDYED